MFPLLDYRGPLPHEKYAAHFKVYEHIRDSEHCEDDRAALRDLWEQFEKLGLADPTFVERFPTELGSRVWEMRLACTFAGWGRDGCVWLDRVERTERSPWCLVRNPGYLSIG